MKNKFQSGENITYKSSKGASIVEINENKILTLLNE